MLRDCILETAPELSGAVLTGTGTFAWEFESNESKAKHSEGTGEWNLVYIIPPQVREIRSYKFRTKRTGSTTSLKITTRKNGVLELNAVDIRPSSAGVFESKFLNATSLWKPGDRMFIRIESNTSEGTNHFVDDFRIVGTGTSCLKEAKGHIRLFADINYIYIGSGTQAVTMDLSESKVFAIHTGTDTNQLMTFRTSFAIPLDFQSMDSSAITFRTYRDGNTDSLTLTVYDSDGVADPSCTNFNIRASSNQTYQNFSSALTGNYRPGERMTVTYSSTVDDTEFNKFRIDRLLYNK